MKKQKLRLICAIALILAMLLCSCNGNNQPVDTTESSESTTDESGSSSEVVTEPSDPVDGDLNIIADGVANYKLIRPSDAPSGVISSASMVYNTIKDVTGVAVEFSDDFVYRGQEVDPNEKAILVGLTNRAESATAMNELDYGDYTVKKIGNKVIIAAWDEVSLSKACNEFKEYVEKNGTNNNLKFREDFDIVKTGFEEVKPIPHYNAQNFNIRFIDLADDSYMLYIARSSKDEFVEYMNKLKDSGFSEFSNREINGSIFATFKNDKNIINITYTAGDKSARITIDEAYDTTILEEREYQKICDPSITMVGLETYGGKDPNQIGLLLIFKLEDGRFIVVDGGGYYNECSTIIYNNLKNLAEDPNNITVAAWFFTHAHGDHTGGFIKFAMSSYGKRVNVQNFIYNFTTETQYDSVDKGPDHGRANEARTACATYYPKANIIKIHTGQVIKAANAEIEMLYTFDDTQPDRLTYHNTTSLVFRYINKADGYSIMCLGDAYTVTSGKLSKTYGTYLKSDMVQIAHHGYVGGTDQLYKNISATVNIWPGGLLAFEGPRNLKGESYNAYALSLPTVKESFIAGANVFTFPIPYTPDPAHQNTIIKSK